MNNFKNKIQNQLSIILTLIILIFVTHYLLNGFIDTKTLPGFGGDPYFCAYITKQVLINFQNGLSILDPEFWDIPMFYPTKRALALSDPFILPGYFIYLLKFIHENNFIFYFNISFIFFIILNWICCYLFFKTLLRSFFLSILGSWLWAFSPFILAQSAHFQNIFAFPIPLSLFFINKIIKNKFILINSIGIALSIFLLACSNLYYLAFELILLFIFLFLWIFFIQIKDKWKKFISLFLAIISGISLSFIILYRFFEIKSLFPEYKGSRDFQTQVSLSSSLMDYVSGNLVSPIYNHLLPNSESFERSGFNGIVTSMLFLLFISLIIFWFVNKSYMINKNKIIFFNIFIIFFTGVFLASGALMFPELFKFIGELVPSFQDLRAIGRANLLTTLSECLAVSYISMFLFQFFKFHKQIIFSFFLILFIFFQVVERIVPNYKNWKVNFSAQIEGNDSLLNYIKNDQNSKILLKLNFVEDIPFHLRDALLHEKTIVNGYSGYGPRKIEAYYLKHFLTECKIKDQYYTSLFQKIDIVVIDKKDLEFVDCLEKLQFKPVKIFNQTTVFKRLK